jgi:hypothetical protein
LISFQRRPEARPGLSQRFRQIGRSGRQQKPARTVDQQVARSATIKGHVMRRLIGKLIAPISRVTLLTAMIRLATFGGAMVPAVAATIVLYVCGASVHLIMAVLLGIAAAGVYLGRRITTPAA